MYLTYLLTKEWSHYVVAKFIIITIGNILL